MDSQNCLFCKIAKGEVPAKFVYKDEKVAVFEDINPKAKHHLLVVPVEHVETFLDLTDSHFPLLTNMIKVVQQLVIEKKINSAYRLVINGGSYQKVPHLHIHILGD